MVSGRNDKYAVASLNGFYEVRDKNWKSDIFTGKDPTPAVSVRKRNFFQKKNLFCEQNIVQWSELSK